MASGQALIDLCKTHLIETMRSHPECAPGGPGLGNKQIEDAAGFALHLPAKDNYLTWSLLFSLILDGKVETAHTGKSRPKYRAHQLISESGNPKSEIPNSVHLVPPHRPHPRRPRRSHPTWPFHGKGNKKYLLTA